jgi:putative chitinase
MFPGRIRNPALVTQGLPSLLKAMAEAKINTPARIAALLATLDAESWFEYNVLQGGSNTPTGMSVGYTGRGFIQLTGADNYTAAGKHLGIDLVNHPELAQSLEWSAEIVKWYWTVARPSCNRYADNLQMGKINAAIGYPLGDGKADLRRCASFARAFTYLTGSAPVGATCTR